MSWLPIIALALLAFLAAAFVLRIKRGSWTILGAVLLFGLAGYAMQGMPGMPASPGRDMPEAQEFDGELLIGARREFFDTAQFPSRWVVTGDSYFRRGEYADAAAFYRNAVEENERDTQAWLGLGSALVEHAEGNLTPAALLAFERAGRLEDGRASARYFLGLAWLRAGQVPRTRELWAEALAMSDADSSWREPVALQLAQLERMMDAQNPR